MDEDGGAREVPEKARAEPVSGVRPGDEARDVGQDEARLVVHAHDAEMRREGGEGKVRDARACGRDGADERRLPDVREADEPDVGQHAELEAQLPPLARGAPLGAAGRAVGRCREVHVATAAVPPSRHHDLFFRGAKIAEWIPVVRVVHQCPGRHAEHEIGPALALLLLAPAVLAPSRTQRLRIREVEERRESGVDAQDDRAAVATVAAARAATRHVLLPPEAHAAVAPVAGLDPDQDLVDELHRLARMLADGPGALHPHASSRTVATPVAKRRKPAAKARWATPVRTSRGTRPSTTSLFHHARPNSTAGGPC